MKTLPILIFSSLLMISCLSNKSVQEFNQGIKTFAPPGTKRVAEHIYADENEISISGYALYLDWMKHVYGDDAAIIKAAMPDSSIISKTVFDSLNIKLDYIALHDYPIVGISYDQAKLYTEWRTNRVAEFFLIEKGKVKVNRKATPETQFTIEKYIEGNYGFSYNKDKIYFFPIYSIPSKNEWKTYIYQGIQDSILNEGYVKEIVILENEVRGKTDKSRPAESELASQEIFTHNFVGKGNINIGFRNICKWVYFKPDSTAIVN